MQEEKLLTLQKVAERLQVSERSVFRYIHSGRLKASKVGCWRISQQNLEDFLKENSNDK